MAGRAPLRIVGGMTATTTATTPTGRSPRRRPVAGDGQVFGLLLVVGGALWMIQRSGVIEIGLEVALACLLIALGVGMVVTARRAGGAPLVLLGVLLTVALAASSSVDVSVLRQGIGDRTFRPAQLADRGITTYELGLGTLDLDLGGLTLPAGSHHAVEARVGVGQLVVHVPAGTTVRTQLHAGVGQLTFLGRTVADGTDVRRSPSDVVDDPNAPELDLELESGVGAVVVERNG